MYNRENIFAKILRKELPCNLMYEDQFSLAFYDIDPVAPLHVLVIPKGEFISFSDFIKKAQPEFVAGFFASLQRVIELLEVEDSGYRIISNSGVEGMQTVAHFHVHILAKKMLGALLVSE